MFVGSGQSVWSFQEFAVTLTHPDPFERDERGA